MSAILGVATPPTNNWMLAPPKMASIAPFGTDLQPILRPKIMYSRVIHVPESLINVKESSEFQEETILQRNYEEHNHQPVLDVGMLQAVQPQLNK